MNTRIFFYSILLFIVILFAIAALADGKEEPPPKFECNEQPMGSFRGVPGVVCGGGSS